MNIRSGTIALAAATACVLSQFGFAANPPSVSLPEKAIAAAVQEGKLIYLVFYKDTDAPTKAVMESVKLFTGRTDGSTFTTVKITDPAERAVAEKYQVTRAPMPMVIGVHANGAVTGYFHTKISDADLTQCVVSPKKAECMKALQQNKLVLVCLQTQPQQGIPQGVADLTADPHFSHRTQVVTLSLNDPAEASFLAGMEVDPKKNPPQTVFLAPPGVVVGKFAATAQKNDLAAKLAEAGKCCDDKNCKHNQQSAKQTQQPGRTVR